jgi:hypothetical protein
VTIAVKPRAGLLDVHTQLRHFAIITYEVSPDALRPLVHPRFDLDCIAGRDGAPRALVSVVPFEDEDFAFDRMPWLRLTFGQTNYRAYVRDMVTGEQAVWFFGTALDSVTVTLPRYGWRLPWHRARIRFDCAYDASGVRYSAYRMSAVGAWAPAELELRDTGVAPDELSGFDSLATGMQTLTHPLSGYYYRRDQRLGSYRVSHPRLQPTVGRATTARFPLLDRLGLVTDGDLSNIHSVLIQPRVAFRIHLPPTFVESG